MSTVWSEFVQTSEELYLSRNIRFRQDNKEEWLPNLKLKAGMRILEIGCGPGLLTQRIKQLVPNSSVTGLDRDSGHIRYAKQKSNDLGVECEFLCGDALGLPFDENSFDACTSHTVIEHVDADLFLKEQYRVLKPGGVVSVLSVWPGLNVSPENFKPENTEEKRLFDKAWHNAKDFEEKHGICAHVIKENEVPVASERAGFRNINVSFSTILRYAPDNDEVSPELAKMQINVNRLHSVASVHKAMKIDPEALTKTEMKTLLALINERYDKRIEQYEKGEKVWDMATSCIMFVTGYK